MGIAIKQPGTKSGPQMSAGLHQAVVSEVRDLGLLPDKFNAGKTKRAVAVTFSNAAGEQASRVYSPTLHEKSSLGKDLRALFNGEIPEKYRNDMEALEGLQCQVLATVVTNDKGYKNARVQSVLPPAVNQNVVPVEKPAAAAAGDDVPF